MIGNFNISTFVLKDVSSIFLGTFYFFIRESYSYRRECIVFGHNFVLFRGNLCFFGNNSILFAETFFPSQENFVLFGNCLDESTVTDADS